MLKRREVIISIFLFIPLIALTIVLRTESFFAYGIAALLLYLLFACTIIYALIRVIIDRRSVSFITKMKYLLVCSLLFLIVLLFSFFIQFDGGKTASLTAGFHHDLNSAQLKLFTDSSFSFLNAGPLGGTTYRGTYHSIDDTIRLECSHEELRRLYPSLDFVNDVEGEQRILRPTDSLSWPYRLVLNSKVNPKR